jgi:hypothetical protein
VRVLFDQGTPAPLRNALADHEVVTAYERGWARLKNGELLSAAELDGFEIFVTTDKNLRYQQDLSQRRIAIVVLSTTSWPRISKAAVQVCQAVGNCTTGDYVEVAVE